jgi:hypothetical protein
MGDGEYDVFDDFDLDSFDADEAAARVAAGAAWLDPAPSRLVDARPLQPRYVLAA